MSLIRSDFSGSLQLPLSQKLLRESAGREVLAADAAPTSFPDLLRDGVLKVNSMQQDANSQVHELLTGGDVNQTEVFTSVQKADMAFRMLVQVRNKLLAAYEEINNIRI